MKSYRISTPKFQANRILRSFVLHFYLFTDRIRRMGEGNVFSLFTGGGGGGTYPKVSTPCQGTSPIQVRTGEGVPQATYPLPRYLPPWSMSGQGVPQGTCPPVQVRTGGTQGTYPPSPTAKVAIPCQGSNPSVQVRIGGGGTPRYLPHRKVPIPRG